MTYRPNPAILFDRFEARFLADGIPYRDLRRLQARVGDWDEWLDAWGEIGREYETRADGELARGHRTTAGDLYWLASMFWHCGQLYWFNDLEGKDAAQTEKVRLYARAAPLFDAPAERVDVPFEDTRIPGYLRLPIGSTGPVACVVLIGGLDSTKEESYLFENMCLRRGLATFTFDGPGQGEYLRMRPIVADFERYTSAVAAFLVARPDIDGDRIGVLGRSLGGYYSVRAAAADPVFKACVPFGAMYQLAYYDDLPEPTRMAFRHAGGFPDDETARKRLPELIDLSDVAGSLAVPTYVVHGEQDPLIPLSEVQRLVDTAPNAAITTDVEPEGAHCCHNLHHLVRPRMADWLVDTLQTPPSPANG